MQGITTVDLDIAKSVFQVHGIDHAWQCGGQATAKAVVYVATFFEKLSTMATCGNFRGQMWGMSKF